jgi:hypothetical protein
LYIVVVQEGGIEMQKYTRRDFIRTVAAGTAAAAFPFELVLGRTVSRRKPNVVILFIDDLGYGDLACFGNKRTPTPHIDSMAAKGAKCTMS